MKIDKLVQKNKDMVEGIVKELSEEYAIREADELKITGEMKAIMSLIRINQATLKKLCPSKEPAKC